MMPKQELNLVEAQLVSLLFMSIPAFLNNIIMLMEYEFNVAKIDYVEMHTNCLIWFCTLVLTLVVNILNVI